MEPTQCVLNTIFSIFIIFCFWIRVLKSLLASFLVLTTRKRIGVRFEISIIFIQLTVSNKRETFERISTVSMRMRIVFVFAIVSSIARFFSFCRILFTIIILLYTSTVLRKQTHKRKSRLPVFQVNARRVHSGKKKQNKI